MVGYGIKGVSQPAQHAVSASETVVGCWTDALDVSEDATPGSAVWVRMCAAASAAH